MNNPTDSTGVKQRALIVDDDEAIRETIRFALEEDGYTVIEACDGISALNLVRSSADRMVVLLDEIMPGLDGAEVLQQISADQALAKRHAYILITATARIERLRESVAALPALSVPILRKPFNISDLLTTVRQQSQRLSPAANSQANRDEKPPSGMNE